MRKPTTVWFGGGWAECVSAELHWERKTRVGIGPMPWLTAAQCRRLAAWLLKAAEWIEAKEGGRQPRSAVSRGTTDSGCRRGGGR